MSSLWINAMELKNSSGNSCTGGLLFACALDGNVDKLNESLTEGTPAQTADTVGTTALHCAVMGGQLRACQILLASGLSVDVRTKVERTPLHLAVFYGHKDVVQLLLDHSCKVDPLDMFNMTPLHWAAEKGHVNLVRLLLAHGANQNIISKFNKTPRKIAEQKQFWDIVAVLDNNRGDGAKSDHNNESTISLILEMKKEKNGNGSGGRTTIQNAKKLLPPDVCVELEDATYEEENTADEDIETMSIFAEDDVVEVIPSGEHENSMENGDYDDVQDPKRGMIVAHDSDDSNLHDTINKLGNIRGLRPTDAPTLKMLQNIGIQISEDHDPTIVSNVLQSGRKMVLSEAGKYILQQTKNEEKLNPTLPQRRSKIVPMGTSTPKSLSVKLVPRVQKNAPAVVEVPPAKRTRRSNEQTNVESIRVDEDVIVEEGGGGDGGGSEEVPMDRIKSLETKVGSLQNENKELRSLLEGALVQIKESKRRIEQLEKASKN